MPLSTLELARALSARTITCDDLRNELAHQTNNLPGTAKLVRLLQDFVRDDDFRKSHPDYAAWQEFQLRYLLDEVSSTCDDAGRECHAGGVVAGTLVHTSKGLLPIEALLEGDSVLSLEDGSIEKGYRRIIKTAVSENQPIRGISYCADDSSFMLHHCYLTSGQLLCVDGLGWTRSEDILRARPVLMMDGSGAGLFSIARVSRAPEAGFGWVPAHGRDESGHIVDFRAGSNLWKYVIGEEDQAPAPYLMEIDISTQMRAIFASSNPLFKTRVYSLEVEGSGTYCIGEGGVLTRGRGVGD